jgi:hypothetical protein
LVPFPIHIVPMCIPFVFCWTCVANIVTGAGRWSSRRSG